MARPKKKFQFQYVILNHIPGLGGRTSEEWDKFLSPAIRDFFLKELTAGEVSLITAVWDGSPIVAEKQPDYQAIVEKLDAFILFQSETLGWRITLSELVRSRMADWQAREADGSKKFELLGRAMANAARRSQGQLLPPMTDPGWYSFREVAIRELKLLSRRFENIPNRERQKTDTLEWITSQIQQQPDFPVLSLNYDSLLNYLRQNYDLAHDGLLKDQLKSASQFFNNWMGRSIGRVPEKFGQTISRIGSKKKSVI